MYNIVVRLGFRSVCGVEEGILVFSIVGRFYGCFGEYMGIVF